MLVTRVADAGAQRRATKTYSRLSSWNGSPAKPPWSASSCRPATSRSPNHSFLVAHHRELVALVEGDVDSVVADRVLNGVGDGLVLVGCVEAGRDLVVEGEGV